MAMTPEEMGRVTLAEFEAMATRFAAALAVLRDAQALLQGVQDRRAEPAPAPSATPLVPQNPMLPTPVQWTEQELAERERLRRQRLAELPEAIRAAESAQ